LIRLLLKFFYVLWLLRRKKLINLPAHTRLFSSFYSIVIDQSLMAYGLRLKIIVNNGLQLYKSVSTMRF